jgi:hypothetical protein
MAVRNRATFSVWNQQASSVAECQERILRCLTGHKRGMETLANEARLSKYQTQVALRMLRQAGKVRTVVVGTQLKYELAPVEPSPAPATPAVGIERTGEIEDARGDEYEPK